MPDDAAVRAFLEDEKIEYRAGVPLRDFTSFRIGGPARFFAVPSCPEQAASLLRWCGRTGCGYFVLGKGSNLCVSDGGFGGVVIYIGPAFSKLEVSGTLVTAGAGARLSSLCRFAADSSLSGLEFAYGIPGSVGGGVCMNAGAYGGELADRVVSVSYIGEDGTARRAEGRELGFSYRRSMFSERRCIVTGATFRLEPGDARAISAKMEGYLARRSEKQPLDLPSAGSVFLRPEGHFAGALIEQAGLKGRRCGGAEVSAKHAGFIVNTGGATAEDVVRLIGIIKEEVLAKSGVRLQCEIKLVGFGG